MRVAAASGKFYDSIGLMGQAASVGANMLNAETQRTARYLAAAGGDWNKAIKLAAEDQKKQGQGNAAALARSQQDIKTLGSTIREIVDRTIAPFATSLISLGQRVTDFVSVFVGDSSGSFQKRVEKVSNWFENTFIDLQDAFNQVEGGSFSGMFKKLSEKLVEGVKNIKEYIAPMWNAMKPALLEIWTSILKPAFISLLDLMWGAFREWAFGPTADKLAKVGQERKEDKVAEKVASAAFKNQAAEQLGADATTIQIKNLADKLQKDSEQRAAQQALLSASSTRHSGTLGMTGNWWEKQDATVQIQAGESVVTQEQMAQIVSGASQTNVTNALQQLNSLTAQMLAYAKVTAEYAKRNVAATKSLDGNLFASI
jgi:hypothetical protein